MSRFAAEHIIQNHSHQFEQFLDASPENLFQEDFTAMVTYAVKSIRKDATFAKSIPVGGNGALTLESGFEDCGEEFKYLRLVLDDHLMVTSMYFCSEWKKPSFRTASAVKEYRQQQAILANT